MLKKVLMGLSFIGLIFIIGAVGAWETSYTRLATCTHMDDRIAIFTDNDGNMWEWQVESDEFFKVGDAYRLYMSDNHSVTIYDDYITKIKNY